MVNVAHIASNAPAEQTSVAARPTVRGKFLYVGKEKLWVRGVSYGTFLVDENGEERLTREVGQRDFSLMAAYSFHVVRVQTGLPRLVVDMALENGLRVKEVLNS